MKKTNRHCPMRRLFTPSIALAGLVAVPAALAAPAFAEEPEELKSTVTDTAGMTSNEKTLRDALASTQDKTHKSVYIVFVENSGSKTTDIWARDAFRKSGLSRSGSLIAVVTETHGFSLFTGGSGYPVAELRKTLNGSGVYGKWCSGNQAGGAKSVVFGLEENTLKKEETDFEGAGESKGSGISGSTAALFIGVLAVGAGTAGGVYVWRRCKKGKELEAKNAEDLASLSRRAARQLLETDDGVRGAAAELEFARAEFGVRTTKQFTRALAPVQDSMQKAFVVRQELDDDIPEAPQQQWEMNQRIFALTASACESITTQEQGFQNLRNLLARVDQYLAELQTRADGLDGQRDILVAEIDSLALTYSQTALATLRTYPDQIVALVVSARSSIASGHHSASERKRNGAIAFACMAKEMLDHAAAEAEEIRKVHGSLDDAFQKVHAALASISSDVVDVKCLGTDNPVIAARQADAEKAIAAHSNGGVDPVRALSELAAAEDMPDAALINVRNADEIRKYKKEASQRNQGITRQAIDCVEKIEGYGCYADQKARTLLAAARENIVKGNSAQSSNAKDDYYKVTVSAAGRAEDEVIDLRECDSHRYDYGACDGSGIGRTMGGMLVGMMLRSLFNGGNDDRHEGDFSTGSLFGSDSDDGGSSLGSFFDGDSNDGGGFDFGSGNGGGFNFDLGSGDGRSFQNFIDALPKGTGMAEKQTILGWITQFTKANINVLLGKAENPQKILGRMIRDYTNPIAEAQGAVAVAMDSLRLAQADYQGDIKASREWGQKTLTAPNKAEQVRLAGNKQDAAKFDNLTKIAISKQMASEKEIKDAEPLVTSQEEIVAKLKDDPDQMRSKPDELKTKYNQLVARARTAGTQNRVQDAISSINVLDPTSELGRYEDQTRRQEALAQDKAEVAVSSLNQRFAELEDHSQDIEIETRLVTPESSDAPARIETCDFNAYWRRGGGFSCGCSQPPFRP